MQGGAMSGVDVEMPVEVAGLRFRNPFVVGSGPASKTVEQLVAAEHAGWAGAALKLTMDPPPYSNREQRSRWFARRCLHMLTSVRRLNIDGGVSLFCWPTWRPGGRPVGRGGAGWLGGFGTPGPMR